MISQKQLDSVKEKPVGAIISDDEKFRYLLWRRWDSTKPFVLFIGLNPSTADGETDDPTIRRCIKFAKDWGYGEIRMVNLFAYRATKPEDMMAAPNPYGDLNDFWVLNMMNRAKETVAAWGNKGSFKNQHEWMIALLDTRNPRQPVMCLGKNKDGSPKHPLYIKADKRLEVF
jgi:hypothetical protein